MRLLSIGPVGALALIWVLGACVAEPGKMADKAPAPALAATYDRRADGAFEVPAVPVEKVPPEFLRQSLRYVTDQPPGTVIIDPGARHLYLITGQNRATRYGISVGKAGFEWSGEAEVAGRKSWPRWTPPKEMIARRPELAKWAKGQPGGPENPLGARALYLKSNGVDYGYRIHGTPEWFSIGKNASSGCIRMLNQDVIDLYDRVTDGARVIVLTADGKLPGKLTLPPKPARKAKPTAPAVQVAAAEPAAATPCPAPQGTTPGQCPAPVTPASDRNR